MCWLVTRDGGYILPISCRGRLKVGHPQKHLQQDGGAEVAAPRALFGLGGVAPLPRDSQAALCPLCR